jgi:cellulose synthase/poly-beta-1,6-N-acetylglucosamine synthase-like glycosyltransferase
MENNKLFSILICTLIERQKQFRFLNNLLNIQLNKYNAHNDVEVISCCDNRQMSVGAKRNKLLDQASGKFIAFIDDDDAVDIDYIKAITTILKENSDIDCIGIKGVYTVEGRNPKLFIHSLKYNSYFEAQGIYYRCPNHLNPIRKECIKNIRFPEQNRGEDTDWALKIRDAGVLKKEVMFDKKPLYFYRFSPTKTCTQR